MSQDSKRITEAQVRREFRRIDRRTANRRARIGAAVILAVLVLSADKSINISGVEHHNACIVSGVSLNLEDSVEDSVSKGCVSSVVCSGADADC